MYLDAVYRKLDCYRKPFALCIYGARLNKKKLHCLPAASAFISYLVAGQSHDLTCQSWGRRARHSNPVQERICLRIHSLYFGSSVATRSSAPTGIRRHKVEIVLGPTIRLLWWRAFGQGSGNKIKARAILWSGRADNRTRASSRKILTFFKPNFAMLVNIRATPLI